MTKLMIAGSAGEWLTTTTPWSVRPARPLPVATGGTAGTATGAIAGRRDELEVVETFLDDVAGGPRVLLIEGQAGIGKTTLWAAGLDGAGRRCYRVLSCRAASAEVRLGYAALADLVAEVEDRVFEGLAAPQRAALDAMLFRRVDLAPAPDPRAVAVAVLSVLEALAAECPVVVAVDDLHWLDDPSAQALHYAVRRLSGPVGVLVSVRTPEGEAVADLRPRDPERLGRLRVGPLSLAALHRLLHQRTGRSFPRPMLVRLHQVVDGNPFYALELARTVGHATTLDPAVVPPSLAAVVSARLAALDPGVQEALLVVSALADAHLEVVGRALGGADATEVLGRAEAQGVLALERGRVRFRHPLLAVGVYGAASPPRRRAIHRRLSQVVDGVEERARHLALAAVGPEPEALAALGEAMAQARRRGAPAAAAELAELAIGLDAPDAALRLRAADCHLAAGNPARATQLVEEAIAALGPGPDRAAALGLLGRIRYSAFDLVEAVGPLEQALAEAGDDHRVRAELGIDMCYVMTKIVIGDRSDAAVPADALPYAVDALRAAERCGDAGLLAKTLAVNVIVGFLAGHGLDEASLTRALQLEDGHSSATPQHQPTTIAGCCSLWSGRLDEAQTLLSTARSRCVERGDESAAVHLAPYLTCLACWRGDVTAAQLVADDAIERAAMLGGPVPRGLALAAQAMVDAFAGQADEARRSAVESLRLFQEAKVSAFRLWPLSTLCLIDVSVGDFDSLVSKHGPLAMTVAAQVGAGEPMTTPFVADVAEALVAIGRLDEAEHLVDQLEERGRRLDRAWALAVGGRCRGLVLGVRGDLEAAMGALDAALADHERLPMPLERGRTLLVRGQIQRRANDRRAARASLEEALVTFEAVGARLWVDKARAELRRLGGRRVAPDVLTVSEGRVAALAATGLTNRGIAAQLFISPKTVEANLARAYRKMGIRTRAELGARLGEGDPRVEVGQT